MASWRVDLREEVGRENPSFCFISQDRGRSIMLSPRLLPPCIVEGRNPLAKLGSSELVWVGSGRVGKGWVVQMQYTWLTQFSTEASLSWLHGSQTFLVCLHHSDESGYPGGNLGSSTSFSIGMSRASRVKFSNLIQHVNCVF